MKSKNESSKDLDKKNEQEMPKWAKVITHRYFKFSVVCIIYLLWTFWVGNWWMLLGVPIVFDIYVSKKVNWSFWKKRNGPNNKVVEWLDALIFAVIAVTLINIFVFQNYKIPTGSMEKTLRIGDHLYVSKLKYGPKMPNTPISFPFAQNILPLTKSTKSYVEWIKWPYKRLAGFTHVKNDDNVVFNFPEGDTVLLEFPANSYYAMIRDDAVHIRNADSDPKPLEYYENEVRKQVLATRPYVVRPVDKCDNYIKRCVAIPGDTLKIVDAKVFINGKPQEKHAEMQFNYVVKTDGQPINPKALERLDIYKSDVGYTDSPGIYRIPLTETSVEALRKMNNVKSVEMHLAPAGYYDYAVFPHDQHYPWNVDNFGPLWIPKKGASVKLDSSNLTLYRRIITAYEHNKLEVKNGKIFINDAEADSYTFKMDYYWMMGDNRHNSLDSRFFGFVPEDHIVGAPRVIWLSLDKEKTFPFNINWKRMFRGAGR